MKANKIYFLFLSLFITINSYSSDEVVSAGIVSIKINEKQQHDFKINTCYIPEVTMNNVKNIDVYSISNYSIRAFGSLINNSYDGFNPGDLLFFLDGRNNFSKITGNEHEEIFNHQAKFYISLGKDESYSGFIDKESFFNDRKLTYIATKFEHGFSDKVKSTNNKIEIKIDCK